MASIFGVTIISTNRLVELEKYEVKFNKIVQCRDWFSGWQDLDIIWSYIFDDVNFGGIERAREDYAKTRGTSVYGRRT